MANRKHEWVKNTALTNQTGIKRVCMVCGQTDPGAEKVCPGRRA